MPIMTSVASSHPLPPSAPSALHTLAEPASPAPAPSSSAAPPQVSPASPPVLPDPAVSHAARAHFRAQGQRIAGSLAGVTPAASQAGLTVLPELRRRDIGPPLFRAELAPGAEARPFFGENAVPMASMVVNAGRFSTDSLHPGFIARAAVQANPDIRLLVPTRARFTDTSDPHFISEQRRLADALQVPAANVVPVRSDMAAWPQDEFLAGAVNGAPVLTKPDGRAALHDSYRTRGGQQTSDVHWNRSQRTLFAANDLASELGIQAARSSGVARGGDTHVVTRPDGQQAAYFSAETVRAAAASRGLDGNTEAGFLRGLDITMRGMRDAGIPLENVALLGRGTRTYRAALEALSPQDRSSLDPAVRARLEQLGDLPLPTRAYAYHTDLMFFTPDGKTMFVNEDLARADPKHEEQLRRHGYTPVRLPGGNLNNEELKGLGLAPAYSKLRVSYMNAVTGRDPDGRQVVLLPTEALDPTQLTPRDVQARAAIEAAVPGARVIPVGGRSAFLGAAVFPDRYSVARDFGIHCMSNVLPFAVAPR